MYLLCIADACTSPGRQYRDKEPVTNMRVSENYGYLIFGDLIIKILLFRILYLGPLFSELCRLGWFCG